MKRTLKMDSASVLKRRCMFAWLSLAIWVISLIGFLISTSSFMAPAIELDILTDYFYYTSNFAKDADMLRMELNKGLLASIGMIPLYILSYFFFRIWSDFKVFFASLVGKMQ